ncbi:MAG: histidine phosphatase family protein [Bacteroidetes bacterium]|mgnify:CR=1 FL=1|nr:histidine phosphatase family protein [Bacteroidota bacterium]
MKTLTLVRHAKSDWGADFLKDIDRPLNATGYKDAYLMSEWYLKNYNLPQLLITSTATRALSTSLIFNRAFNLQTVPNLIPSLYESTKENALQVIIETNNSVNHLMLFGHNPFITNLVNYLCTDLDFENIPTCGIVEFESKCENWKEFDKSKIKRKFHQFPKQF